MTDSKWLAETVTRRQFMTEETIAAGVAWPVAMEAVSSTLLAHPEIDADETRTRREWYSQKGQK